MAAKVKSKGTALLQEISSVYTAIPQVTSIDISGEKGETYDSVTLDGGVFKTKNPKLKTLKKPKEEFKVDGEDLLKKVKSLIAEGNIRRISIRNKEGKHVLDIPLTVGVVGAVLVPTLAAVGAVAALLTECTVVVERRED